MNNSHVTHTVLHRLLAEAWRAAGDADSAAVHKAWVRKASAGLPAASLTGADGSR